MQFFNFPEMHLKVQGLDEIRIPKMMKIKQDYDAQYIDDVYNYTRNEMFHNLSDLDRFNNKRIAITAGSRGIPHEELIIKAVVDVLKEHGASPFIVPAMGSHGGATAEGQRLVLEGLNITPEVVGAPILSSMETVIIGNLDDGTPIHCDKYAFESDGIVILNKVKPHTDFRGPHESGLAKMMAIGLGKHAGAAQFHAKGFSTFAERIPKVCELFLEKAPIAFGVGIVQNAYDNISNISVMEKELILEKDAELLIEAKAKIANFKLNHFDVLIIDRIGKNISGNGHDPNITGRSGSPGFSDIIDIKKMFIRGLTEETHHHGSGIYCADITTRRVLNDIDYEAMWTNNITATLLKGGDIPMYAETDKEALLIAIRTCNNIDYQNPRIVRILDTLHMEEIEVSEAFKQECIDNPEIEILSDPYEMDFDNDGNLR